MSDALSVARNRVVQFHYVLQSSEGEELDTSGKSPVAVLVGHGNLMRALEEQLIGHLPGERLEVTLAPAQAFGERRDDWIQRVPKKYVADAARLKPGMQTTLNTESGARTVTVVKVGSKVLDVDLNHPFAGKTVTFQVELLSVREATKEEQSHGHAHGDGGHHH